MSGFVQQGGGPTPGADPVLYRPEPVGMQPVPYEEVPAVAPLAGGELESEKVVVSAPFSYHGSAARIWKITRNHESWAKAGMASLAIALIAAAWILPSIWPEGPARANWVW